MTSIAAKGVGGPPPRRRFAGLAGVVVFHAALIYALVTGLAQGVVKVIQQKVEVSAMVLAESQRLGLTKLGIVGSEQFLQ
ncbi:hypothetical protein AA0N74_00070 [Chromobacterium vaccinii]|uniref:hypothetical protein n=1 Tax=Chromobacterium vaccinii TaxID=1108595 RepID=UPI0031D9141D